MSFHLCGFYDNIASGAVSDINPISDDVLATADGAIVSSSENHIFAGLAMDESLDRARVSTPSLNSLATPHLRPIISAATMPTNPNIAEWLDAPLRVSPGQGFSCDAYQASGVAKDAYVLLWLAQNF